MDAVYEVWDYVDDSPKEEYENLFTSDESS